MMKVKPIYKFGSAAGNSSLSLKMNKEIIFGKQRNYRR